MGQTTNLYGANHQPLWGKPPTSMGQTTNLYGANHQPLWGKPQTILKASCWLCDAIHVEQDGLILSFDAFSHRLYNIL